MTVFYRKYRPQKFSEIIGQDHVVKTLLGQLESGGLSHGYLFSGPKGTGKTSTARILAKAVNCQGRQLTIDKKQLTKTGQKSNVPPMARLAEGGKSQLRPRSEASQMSFAEPCNKCTSCLAISDGSALDLIEIDAASNRNIDDIRDLREKIKFSPVSSRFKVYIVDEVHMLTREAFNALLKTLEEPPAHALFILCTTEFAKLPSTIVSRVQKFKFARASAQKLKEAVIKVAKLEEIKITDEAQTAVVGASDGSYRDAVSLLEQVAGGRREVRRQDVDEIALVSDRQLLSGFIEDLAAFNLKGAVGTVERIKDEGGDFAHFAKELVLLVEKILFIKMGVNLSTLDLESDQAQKLAEVGKRLSLSQVQNLMKLFLIAEGEIKLYPLPQIPLVLAVCSFCLPNLSEEPAVENLAPLPNKKDQKTQGELKEELLVVKSKGVRSTSKSLAKIEKNWGQFLAKVRIYNSHVMAILRSSRPIAFDGVNLTCEVFYRFHKEKLEEPKIVLELDKLLKQAVGQTIRLNFVLARRGANLPKPVVESDVVDIAQKNLERVAREIFSK